MKDLNPPPQLALDNNTNTKVTSGFNLLVESWINTPSFCKEETEKSGRAKKALFV